MQHSSDKMHKNSNSQTGAHLRKANRNGNTYYIVCIDSLVKSIPSHAHIYIMHRLHVFPLFYIFLFDLYIIVDDANEDPNSEMGAGISSVLYALIHALKASLCMPI